MTIAFLVPITSRGRALRGPADADLVRTLVPGILATATWSKSFNYRLYIGYDAGDPFYDVAANRRAVAQAVRDVASAKRLDLVWHRCSGTEHSPCAVWNTLFQRAYDEGCDYFYQLGDDVELLTPGWARDFTRALDGADVRGLGVAGPVDTNRPDFPVLTQAMVSRVHMEIFGTLYPATFRNWFSDNWLTEVYAPHYVHRLPAQRSRNAGGPERYQIDQQGLDVLAREVPLGRSRLRGWLTRDTRVRVLPRGHALGRRERRRIYYIPNGYDFHIADALQRLYTTVVPFGCRDVPDYIETRILAHETPNASRIVIDEVRRLQPDLVYAESAYNIDAEALAFIRRTLRIPVTMWYGDPSSPPGEVDRLVRYARAVDWQFVVDANPLHAAREQGIENVELIPYFGYDHYFYPRRSRKTIDVLFSGKSYAGLEGGYPQAASRRALIAKLNRRLRDRLLVIGEGWEGQQLHNWRRNRVPEWEINDLNNASRIVLAYDAAQLPAFTSLRTWNTLLSGAFLLIKKFPGIEDFFENHRHVAWFEDDDEAPALVDRYLRDDRARERIARAGRRLVEERGWKFSNVARHIVARGLGKRSPLSIPARVTAPAVRRAAGITLVTFATPDYAPAADRLCASASHLGVDRVARFGVHDWLGTPFHFTHLDLVSARRGYGYWIWKPYFIREVLRRATPGEIVVYADAGSEIVAPIDPLAAIAREHSSPIVAFALHGHTNRTWTKRDAFIALDCDAKRYWDAEATNAAFQVYRAGEESLAFVEEWLTACTTGRIITDEPNVLGKRDLPGFKEHRFDQALFSLLCAKRGVEHFRDPSQWGEGHALPNSPYGTIFRHHRQRR